MLWSRLGRRYLPWVNEGGRSTWRVLLADRGITLVGSNVSAWADVVTGNVLVATQAVSDRQGIWTPSSATFGGQPCVDFSGLGSSAAGMRISGPVRTSAQPFTMYLAMRKPGTGFGMIIDGVSTRYPVNASGTTVTFEEGSGASTTVSTLTSVHIFCFKTTTPVTFSVDGTRKTMTGAGGYNGISGIDMGVFGTNYSSKGLWAAMLMHDGIDDDSTEFRVTRWLMTRFGVT